MIMIILVYLCSILNKKLKKRCVKRWALNIKGVWCFNGNKKAARQAKQLSSAIVGTSKILLLYLFRYVADGLVFRPIKHSFTAYL